MNWVRRDGLETHKASVVEWILDYDPKIMLGLENKKGFQVLAWEYEVDFR